MWGCAAWCALRSRLRREHPELGAGTVQRKGLGHMAQACRAATTAQGTGSRAARRVSKAPWAIELDKENVSEWGRVFSD